MKTTNEQLIALWDEGSWDTDRDAELASHLLDDITELKRQLEAMSKPVSDERVKVERMGASEHVFVTVDGATVYQFDDDEVFGDGEKNAEIYRLGLIQKLKESQ